ncbi:N-acetylglucosamine repressor [Devosia equisanguinis]|uniref:N-acetylglucosamine repressor n=1 Tax=Devosia equisanguinis TaxID=2490941 RepID=A0A447I644_9HYPH|nr:ROK family transcriptional regulator [Devosia equisanguinis]VDS02936.1 N-acetylglucosamine repressor [Devosia equisanguinis]
MPDMRFAPPNPLRIADRATGLNSGSVRSYNERLVLSLLLQKDAITRVEMGERTGLSAQTISVLVRSLEQEGLVSKGAAQKGRVGPPTVPLALNPEGAFSIGVSVGPKRTEVVLVDLGGKTRFHERLSNPDKRDGNHSEFLDTIRRAVEIVPENARPRLAGVGLALPHDQRSEAAEDDFFKALQAEIEVQIDVPVFVQNDIAAAASGESMFGATKQLSDYMYFYLGERLHGRLVLNHRIHKGNSPVNFDVGVAALERALAGKGLSTDTIWSHEGWPDLGDVESTWQADIVDEITTAVQAVAQFVQLEGAVFASFIPVELCQKVCAGLRARSPSLPIFSSTISPMPEAIGAASLPFSSIFTAEASS